MYRLIFCKKLNYILLGINNIIINFKLISLYLYKYISKKFWFFILKKITFIINENNLNIFFIKNIIYILFEIYYNIK
ncbi:hypothetical protein CA212_094 [Candidatus Nasuia deltocephalinicola]|nr:hypothetical protein CA212_094 [Candidatus Nasuia deltocephalinicola]